MPPTVSDTAPSAAPPAASPTVLTRPVRYPSDGGALLEHLTRAGQLRTTRNPADDNAAVRPVDCVLLESADITTKASRTTVAILEASARLTCWGGTVTAEARAPGPMVSRLWRVLRRVWRSTSPTAPPAGSPSPCPPAPTTTPPSRSASA